VQAQQWLGIGPPGAAAAALVDWAHARGLSLIELEALHLAACETEHCTADELTRATALAAEVDPVIGGVILAHLAVIAAGGAPSDASEPEIRMLSDLGLWLPLPYTGVLSAREREVSLFAALGYSSRTIASRLYLSVRTVETHLAHAYAKLGVDDRDGLRRWYSQRREAERQQHRG